MTTITLSPDQQNAVHKFNLFMNSDENEFLITGFAGSGKTFLTSYLAKSIHACNQLELALDPEYIPPKIFFTALTNKAATVLSNTVQDYAQTIHGLLQIRVKNDYNTGTVNLDTSNMIDKLPRCILFIDEVSMMDKELFTIIRSFILPHVKIVYIGDPYQLPPVGEIHSPVFTEISNRVHLSQIQRQLSNNPIILLSQQYRELLDKEVKPYKWPDIIPDNKNIFVLSNQDFEKAIIDHFTKSKNTHENRVLAWSNKRVIAYNKYIRSLYTPYEEFQLGEYVITNNPIRSSDRFNSKHLIALAETILQVVDSTPTCDSYNIEGYNITLQFQRRGFTKTYSGFLPKRHQDKKILMAQLATKRDWPNYFNVKDTYLDLRSAHASTVHKSQGSTYKNVFIDLEDISKNQNWKELCRLVYVAITRASEIVYLRGKL